jgi:hypothetical protein
MNTKILLFQGENEKMDVIMRYAVDRLREGGGIVSAYLEVPSPEEAARELWETFMISDDVVFLVDSDPFVTQLVASLRQQGY